jgi:hypothetical protein
MATVREEAGQRAGNAGETSRTVTQREAELNQLHAQMARMEKETAELRLELMQRDEMLAFLKSAHVTVVSLAGSGSAKQAGALLLYDRQTNKAFLYAYNMPPLPPGKTYQLWAIGVKPISAGVFRTDDGHKGRFITHNVPHLPKPMFSLAPSVQLTAIISGRSMLSDTRGGKDTRTIIGMPMVIR